MLRWMYKEILSKYLPRRLGYYHFTKPEDVKRCFRRTVDTGIKHGTVTVLYKDDSYEVTTYRIDGEYKDNRHPTSVEFTSNLANDLRHEILP